AFSQPEHFAALRQQLLQSEHPPFLCLIIPPSRPNEATLAANYQLQNAPTVEAALPIFIHSYHLPNGTDNGNGYKRQTITDRLTEVHQGMETPLPDTNFNFPSLLKKRQYLLGSGVLTLLLVLSAVIVPFLFFIPSPSSKPSAPATMPLGMLAFGSSGQFNPDLTQGYNDTITLSLRSISTPPQGMSYYIWLMPDPGDDATQPLLISTLHA